MLFGKTNYGMFHYSLRVIDEPKMSEIKFSTCADRGSIFTESRSSSFTKVIIFLTSLSIAFSNLKVSSFLFLRKIKLSKMVGNLLDKLLKLYTNGILVFLKL